MEQEIGSLIVGLGFMAAIVVFGGIAEAIAALIRKHR